MKYEGNTIRHGNGSPVDRREPAEIERDVESIRLEMSETLRRLEQKFSPRDLLSQLTSNTRGLTEGSAEFAKNLGSAVRDNPVPVLLLATGVASLLIGDRSARRRHPLEPLEEGTGGESSLSQLGHGVSERASSLTHGVSERASSLKHGWDERTQSAKHKASELSQGAKRSAEGAKRRASELQERARHTAEDLRHRGEDALQAQPMLVVGLGVTLGALLGAIFPPTERERQLAGPIGDRALTSAKSVAREGVERAKGMLEQAKGSVSKIASGEGQEQAQGQGAQHAPPQPIGTQQASPGASATPQGSIPTRVEPGSPRVGSEPTAPGRDPTAIPIKPEDERTP